MQRRWTFHSFREEVTVVVRASASPLELACAEGGSAAVAHLERPLRWERHQAADQRQLLIGMAELSIADARAYSTDALQRAVFNRLRGSGALILVRDLLEEAQMERRTRTLRISWMHVGAGRQRPRPRGSGRRWVLKQMLRGCTGAAIGRRFATSPTSSWCRIRSSNA